MLTTPAQDKLEELGIDHCCDRITNGVTMTALSAEAGVSIGTLITWLRADPERSARAEDARRSVARIWDERAEARVEQAADAFELAKARELAFHYRWRASKIAPAEYGDKQIHTGADGIGPVAFQVVSGVPGADE